MTEALVHVVDDDAAMRDSLRFLLQSAGFSARTYASGAQLLSAAAAGLGAGCIVTDVRMPEMSGLEMVRRLRERGVALPVIMITGHGDTALALDALKAGVWTFLEKPFDDDALIEAVASALGGRVDAPAGPKKMD